MSILAADNKEHRMTTRTYNEFSLFSGLGGGSLGFARAHGTWRGVAGRYRCIGGVEIDREACDDHEALTGVRPLQADVATITVERMRGAASGLVPDVVFTSPPCKGFSQLLSTSLAATEKYQLLNRLVFQGVWTCLEAWQDRPPRAFVLENVPMIRTRGSKLLHQLRELLARYGYRTDERVHDCGELGGLAQHRRRFLMVARHEASMPTLVYKPPAKRIRAIGEVLGELPMPNDPSAGPLHRLPRLELKTWARLAVIPAGKDWRAIGVRRPGAFNNVLRVVPWTDATGAVNGGGTPTSSGICVGDPRLPEGTDWHCGIYRVQRWDSDPSCTVTGRAGVSTGAFAVGDPRLDSVSRPGRYGVADWSEPTGTVSGQTQVTGSNAVGSVADPRIDVAFRVKLRNGQYGVMPFDRPAGCVVGSASVDQGQAAIADPHWPFVSPPVPDANGFHDRWRPDPYIVIVAADGTWHRPLTTLELAALQSLPTRMADGSPLTLSGRSTGRWRERIGNAVPVDAAQAIGSALLESLVLSDEGHDVWLDSRDKWVAPAELAMACDS